MQELLKDKYAHTNRREDNRNTRFRNTTWNTLRRPIKNTNILCYLIPPYRSVEYKI
jgi:hypothetical protein